MSIDYSDDQTPRKARKRADAAQPADPSQVPGPGGASVPEGPADVRAPKEQGGAQLNAHLTHASGQTASGATPLGPSPCDEFVDPFDAQNRRQLVLVKHGHRYVFRYERGEETKVLAGLVEMARDPKSELDWFDAAVLSHQLGQRMSEQLDRLRRA